MPPVQQDIAEFGGPGGALLAARAVDAAWRRLDRLFPGRGKQGRGPNLARRTLERDGQWLGVVRYEGPAEEMDYWRGWFDGWLEGRSLGE